MSTEFINVKGVKVANIKSDSDNVFFGVGFLAGSNYETQETAGLSHFAEHMFFKGTPNRNWKQVNQDFAKLGCSPNAYTSHNEVFYFATAPKENIRGTVNIISDMVFNSTIPEDEIEKERTVILEEKQMGEDNPRSDFTRNLLENLFVWQKGHATIGTEDVIKNVQREDFVEFLNSRINLENMIFICSGNIDTDELAGYIEENMPSDHPYLTHGEKNVITEDLWSDSIDSKDRVKYLLERENLQQSSVIMVMDGLPVFDPDYVNSCVAVSAVGGGMYSKLFSRIREELGLCYSVSMSDYTIGFPNDNVLWLSGSTSEKNVELFMDECETILNDVRENGIDEDLFECAKTDTLASTYRSTETSAGKAKGLVAQYLYGKENDLEDDIAKIKAVTIEDCNRVVKTLFDQQFNWAIMTPKK